VNILPKKSIFSPANEKNCEKISPYFSLLEVENCPQLHFFGKKLSRLVFFGGKIVKICTFWGINCKNLQNKG